MLLTVVGLGFSVLNGTNDGGTLLAASLKAPGIRPAVSIGTLAVALAIVPLVFGLRVAETLAGGLVPAPPAQQRLLLGLAVAAALVVVAALNLRGLPTSLTLALVGGLVGAGLGAGLEVTWSLVAVTAAVGILAPAAGGALGLALRRSRLFLRGHRFDPGRVHRGHALSFGMQSIAYAANDGQKMYAVLAAGSLAGAGAGVPGWHFVAVPLLFALGAAVGVRRAARTLGGAGVLKSRPRDEVAAELSSALAVLGSGAAGIPVSMTQSVAGSLIGAGMTRGTRRIRWRAAARLVLAWVLTLPTSAALGAGLASAAGMLR